MRPTAETEYASVFRSFSLGIEDIRMAQALKTVMGQGLSPLAGLSAARRVMSLWIRVRPSVERWLSFLETRIRKIPRRLNSCRCCLCCHRPAQKPQHWHRLRVTVRGMGCGESGKADHPGPEMEARSRMGGRVNARRPGATLVGVCFGTE